MADERVGHDFEGQRRKRLIVRRAAQGHLIGYRVHTLDRGTFKGDGRKSTTPSRSG